METFIRSLEERAKELNCLYKIEEALGKYTHAMDVVFNEIIAAIPPGWQYPEICESRIIFEGKKYHKDDFKESSWVLTSDIFLQEQKVD